MLLKEDNRRWDRHMLLKEDRHMLLKEDRLWEQGSKPTKRKMITDHAAVGRAVPILQNLAQAAEQREV